MVWVKLDDKFHSNEKVLDAGYAAAGLYALSLSYCGDHLTDGRVPDAWANQHPKVHRDKLVKAGLWKKAKGGYLIPDFNELNPTKADVEAKRAKQKAGGLKGAANRWKKPPGDSSTHRSTHGVTQGGTQAEPKRPDPKRSLDQDLSPSAEVKTAAPQPHTSPTECPICTVECRHDWKLEEHLQNVHDLYGDTLQAKLAEIREGRT